MKSYAKLYILLLLFGLYLFEASFVAARAQSSLPFDDISDSYAEKQIIDLYNQKIIDGIDYKTFAPDQAIHRAEFTAMLLRVLHMQPVENEISALTDVPKTSWYYGWIHAGINLGIVNGTTSNTFDPNQAITRQEAAALIVRAMKQQITPSTMINLPFQDAKNVSSWAIPYVDEVNQLGLMQGYIEQFRPLDALTREEAVVIFDRILTTTVWSKELNSEPDKEIHLGWQYNQTTEQFINNVKQSTINTLSPRWIFLKEGNQFSDSVDLSLVNWAHQNQKKVWPLVGNRFNTELSHQLLSQPAFRDSAVKQLVDLAQKYHLDGLNIDFENLDPQDRLAFSTFINVLSYELHAHNILLSVCVPPDLGGSWSAPFDYAALGKTADYLVLMGYEEHWPGAPEQGSVSSMPWLENAIVKLTSTVPPDKVIVGLPLYSREWSTTDGKTTSKDLTLGEQNQIVNSLDKYPNWDPLVGQYVVSYYTDRTKRQIWVEDMRSLSIKYRSAKSRLVAGFAYWYVGSESQEIWAGLNNEIKYASYDFGVHH